MCSGIEKRKQSTRLQPAQWRLRAGYHDPPMVYAMTTIASTNSSAPRAVAASRVAKTAVRPTDSGSSSSVGGYYPWLDALRGVSWILVIVGHTLPIGYGYFARMGRGNLLCH